MKMENPKEHANSLLARALARAQEDLERIGDRLEADIEAAHELEFWDQTPPDTFSDIAPPLVLVAMGEAYLAARDWQRRLAAEREHALCNAEPAEAERLTSDDLATVGVAGPFEF